MNKFNDTVYNFYGIFNRLTTIIRDLLDYAVDQRNPLYSLLLFMVTVLLSVSVVIPVSFVLLGSLHAIDAGLMFLMKKVSNGLDTDRPHWVQASSAFIGIAIVPPLTLFYLPALIYRHFKGKKEEMEEEHRRVQESMINDLARWGRVDEVVSRTMSAIWVPVNNNKDFKPKKYLSPHNFNKKHKELFISPGVYTIEREVTRSRRGGNITHTTHSEYVDNRRERVYRITNRLEEEE